MGNHVAEELPSVQAIKVHGQMCSELLRFVIRVTKIFPELEEARPRCSSGIEALCLLNDGFERAKSLLRRCSESSALYLALTGDALLSRCKRAKNLFDQSLSQIHTMVPVILAAKISGIITDLRITEFCLDPSEAEAGKVLQDLLRRCSTPHNFRKEVALAAIRNVSSRLRINSPKALLIEKRSIKKMIDSFGENEREHAKRGILEFFLQLLTRYGKSIALEQEVNGSSDVEHQLPCASPYPRLEEVELCVDYRPNGACIGMLSRPVPPEEFLCPLSTSLMYDPVVIASGQTFERMWIKKWFEEGNDTCPKTKRTLPNLLFTSNTVLKEQIVKWSTEHGVSIPNPESQERQLSSLEISSNSIMSMASSMYNLNLPVDLSNVSLGSNQDSDHSSTEIRKTTTTLHGKDKELLSKFSELPWESQCNAVEDVKKLLKHINETQSAVPSEKIAQLILTFLKDAYNLGDVEAQISGCLLLLEFVQTNGDSISCIKKDDYNFLASFLDTGLSKQALSVLEALSSHRQCGKNIASSDAITGILNILDHEIVELLEPALHILCNLSSNSDVYSFIAPSKIIPKLIPLLEDQTLVRDSMAILRNIFTEHENGRMLIAETEGCIGAIVKVLDTNDQETQEYALSVLLPLCSQRVEYCRVVMDEGIFCNLLSIPINGNDGAKAAALELMRNLKEVTASVATSSNAVATTHLDEQPSKDTNHHKPQGFLGKVFGKKKK